MTQILTRQWPTIFHAATNVPAFVKAFSAFINLKHLKISCPGYEQTQKYCRSTVDFALISLRIAVERNNLNALDTLTLAPIHPGGFTYLSPLLGCGATPRSSVPWSKIKHLDITTELLAPSSAERTAEQTKLAHTYLRSFRNLKTLKFSWAGGKGPLPLLRPHAASAETAVHPLHRPEGSRRQPSSRCRKMHELHFAKLSKLSLVNIEAAASDYCTFFESHKKTIEDVDFKDFELVSGTWEDAFAPITDLSKPRKSEYAGDIPIMLPPNIEQVAPPLSPNECPGRDRHQGKAGRFSRTSTSCTSRSRASGPTAAKKVREGLLGCEEQLKKVIRASVLQWL